MRSRPDAPDLLERSLLAVTGKGGVGKTTVALALALAGAERGRRTILCELTARPRAARMLGLTQTAATRKAVALGPGLSTIAIDPQRALEEWLSRMIGRPGARLMIRSRTFNYFVAAAPGARELVTLGKVWDLLQPRHSQPAPFDLAIVDCPSAGHAVALLAAPSTFGRLAPAGPVAGQARAIRDFLASPRRTGFVGVTVPAELAVSETIELDTRLGEALGRRLDAVVINQVLPERLTDAELARLRGAVGADRDDLLSAAERVARSASVRRSLQEAQLARLHAAFTVPEPQLPFVFRAALTPGDLRAMANDLGAALGHDARERHAARHRHPARAR